MSKHHQAGFTLLEVMVTVFIMAIGLLGLAALQLSSLSYNQSAYLRSQAVAEAYNMLDRMRANRPAAVAAGYVLPLADAPPALDSPPTIVQTDLNQWIGSIGQLPSGDGSVACLLDTGGTPDCSLGVQVMVQWNDQRAEDATTSTPKAVTVEARL